MKTKVLLLFAFLSLGLSAFAQVDTEFWFAAPRLSTHDQNGQFHLMLFSYNKTANITVTCPANPSFTPISTTIAANGYADIPIATSWNDCLGIEALQDSVSNRGILITSDENIGCYFQVTGNNGESYTLKGRNAYGTEFVVGMQNQYINYASYSREAFNGVQIIATQNNTTVTITPTVSAGKTCTTNPLTIQLNRGETYAYYSCGKSGAEHMTGCLITSNKPIVVNSSDDSVDPGAGGQDLVGEQLVPTSYAGTEYVVVGRKQSWEGFNIIVLQDSTDVTLGDGTSYTNLMQGDIEWVSMSSVDAMYVLSTKPVIVYQITGDYKEAGGTMLPQVECTGSQEVHYKRIPGSSNVYVNIMTKTQNINDFYLNGTAIASSSFSVVPGTNNVWSSASIDASSTPQDSLVRVRCATGIFQMGTVDNDGNSMTYGFFSDYAYKATVSVRCNGVLIDTICTVTSRSKVYLVAGLAGYVNEYTWTLPNGTTYVGDTLYFDRVQLSDSGYYTVNGVGSECGTEPKTFLFRVVESSSDCVPEGALEGVFSVADNKKVRFAKGNLQHQPSTNSWRFAEHQYDFIGNANANYSPTYTGWIDLLGWSTTTNNYGVSSSTNCSDYGGVFVDWGATMGTEWYTLSVEEWEYLLSTRPNASQLYGVACVDGVNGCLLLPDNWVPPVGITFNAGVHSMDGFAYFAQKNNYTLSEFWLMEDAGAIFLPCDGCINGTTIYNMQTRGSYWSSSPAADNCHAGDFDIRSNVVSTDDNDNLRYLGQSVRLVVDVNESYSLTNAEICSGDVYNWLGKDYSVTGVYTDTIPTVAGCDSICTLNLIVFPSDSTPFNDTICQGETYMWEGDAFTEAGVYTKTLTNIYGCDSVVSLHLTVYPRYDITLNEAICRGEYYVFGNDTLKTTGSYNYIGESIYGCDSIVILNLKVDTIVKVEVYEETCSNKPFTWYGKSYNSTGTYIYDEPTLESACGYIEHILHLSVIPEFKATVFDSKFTICDGERDKLQVGYQISSGSCDTYSLIYSELAKQYGFDDIINKPFSSSSTIEIEVPKDVWPGIYEFELMFDADSACGVTSYPIHVTILYNAEEVITQRWNDFLSVRKTAYDKYGGFSDYQWFINGQRMEGETGTQYYNPTNGLDFNGMYSVEMTRDIDGIRVRSCEYSPTLQPNTVSMLTISPSIVSAGQNAPILVRTEESGVVTLYNQSGVVINTWEVKSGESSIQAPKDSGLYLLRIQSESGRTETRKLIVE